MNPLRKLAGDTAVYGASSIIGRVLNYLLFPIHTLVFAPAEYGIITELYVFAAFLNVIFVFGMETSFFRFVNRESTDKEEVYHTTFSVVLLITLFCSLLLLAADTTIVNAMNYPGSEHFVWIFLGIMALDAFQAIPFARVRQENRSKLFARAKLTGIFTNIFLNLFFLVVCYPISKGELLPSLQPLILQFYDSSYNLEYVFVANLLASGVAILMIGTYVRKLRFRLNRQVLRPVLTYGSPMMVTGLALVTNEMLSRTALKYWLPADYYPRFSNQEILGIFGGVFKLAIPMNMAIQAFRYAAEPFFFAQAKERESPALFARLLTLFVVFGCIVWIGISVNLELFKYLLRREAYWTALEIVPFLLLGSLFMGINYNLSAWYKLIDRTRTGTWITLSGAVVTIAGNYLLIPLYGYYGSAIAFILAYFTMCVISYTLSRRHNPFPYQIKRIFAYLTSTALLLWGYFTLELTGWTSIIAGNGILFAFSIVIYMIEKKTINRPLR